MNGQSAADVLSVQAMKCHLKHVMIFSGLDFGTPPRFEVPTTSRFDHGRTSHWDRMARLLEATGATVIHANCPHAIYEPPRPWGDFPNHVQGDYIELPPPTACSPARYWHNIAHELIHWAEVRTGWLCMDDAKRELVAEIGAAWLLRSLGLPGDGDHLNFWDWLPQWRKAMLSDREWLFEAVGQVERVVNFLLPP